jgi:hypothetical protein
MKTIKNNKLYVQNSDLKGCIDGCALYKTGIPDEVMVAFVKMNGTDSEYVGFESEESFRFFDKLKYLVDYDEISNLNVQEIVELINITDRDLDKLYEKYNRARRYSSKRQAKIMKKIKLLKSRFYDLVCILNEKQGRIVLHLPYNIEDSFVLSKTK